MVRLVAMIHQDKVAPVVTVPNFPTHSERAALDSIYFGTSIMWLSPFLAELVIWAKWYMIGIFWEKASYMTLGGNGTRDVLFWYGFWAFITMSSFQVLLKILIKRHIFNYK